MKREKHDLDRYTEYLKAQTTELLSNYGPLFTIWYDVPQEFDAKRGQSVIELARSIQPNIVINNRTGAPGDYDTPEQRIGGFQMDRPWETCMTICKQWAWKPGDEMKSFDVCVHTLLRTVGGDGNLLFNVGPQPDGLIEERQVKRLRKMGEWVGRHAEAIYGTRGGPYMPKANLASTRKGQRIYLHVLRWPEKGLRLPALAAKVKSAALLDGTSVEVKVVEKEWLLDVPAEKRDPVATVIMLEPDSDAMALLPVSTVSGLANQGAKLSASAVFKELPEYAAGMAADGDPSTRWATPAGTKEAWLEIDLGAEKSFRSMEIDEATAIDKGMRARVLGFQIEIKDGNQWKPIYHGKGIGEHKICPFPSAIRARFFRIRITDATDGPTLQEVRLLE